MEVECYDACTELTMCLMGYAELQNAGWRRSEDADETECQADRTCFVEAPRKIRTEHVEDPVESEPDLRVPSGPEWFTYAPEDHVRAAPP